MIAMKLIYVILTSVALVSSEISGLLENIVELKTINIRKTVQDLTPTVSEFVINNGLDPYPLQSIEKEFWLPFPGIPLISHKARLSLNSGHLKGLSNLKFNDATLTYENRVLKLAVDVELPSQKMAYNYNLKLRFLNPQGVVTADVKNVHVYAAIAFDTTNYTLTLEEFQLKNFVITNVNIQDKIGWKFWVLSAIADILAEINKDMIAKNVQTDVANALRKELDEINHSMPPVLTDEAFWDKLLQFN